MTNEKKKSTQIVDILSKIGGVEGTQRGEEKWYYSPYRAEGEPSLQVNIRKNIWYDFGEGVGGGVIDFVMHHLKKTSQPSKFIDAIRWLDNETPTLRIFSKASKFEIPEKISSLELKSKGPLKHTGLKRYLSSRGIAIEYANKYVYEAKVYNHDTGKSFFTLAFPNVRNGFEIRNPYFKGCIKPKDISFIRGSNPDLRKVQVFEGFMDFLSVLMRIGSDTPPYDVIVLNSTNCLSKIYPYLNQYTYKELQSWMDNDPMGERTSDLLHDFCKTQDRVVFKRMNNLYKPHKDVNAWLVNKLNLGG